MRPEAEVSLRNFERLQQLLKQREICTLNKSYTILIFNRILFGILLPLRNFVQSCVGPFILTGISNEGHFTHSKKSIGDLLQIKWILKVFDGFSLKKRTLDKSV